MTTPDLLTAASPPPSERVIRALEAHVAAETDDIARCEQLAQTTTDAAVRLLLDLIVEDERHHHALLTRLIHTYQDQAGGSRSRDDGMAPNTAPVDEAELASIRALIRDEHEGARFVRHLARQEPTLDDGLFALWMETIARDSEKHAHVLRFILRRLEGSGAHPDG